MAFANPFRLIGDYYSGRRTVVSHSHPIGSGEEDLIDVDLLRVLPEYNRVRDCLVGEQQVKTQREKYLPRPTADTDPTADKRYEVYLERAVFWNFTQRHHQSLVGQAFLNEPKIQLPARMEAMLENADGRGMSLIQMAKAAFSHLIAYGRCGIYADFPPVKGAVTRDQSGRYKPTIRLISPFKILSWQRNDDGVLVSVLIEETYHQRQVFVTARQLQYRQLALTDSGYEVAIYRPSEAIDLSALSESTCLTSELLSQPALTLVKTFKPTDSSGNRLQEIPFEFAGSENNNETVDKPPLYPLASANLSDYRTSADLEEMLFLGGQPTVWVSDPDPEYFRENYPDGVPLGTRSILQLGPNGQAGVVQIGASDALSTNMLAKRQRIADLGVTISDMTASNKTATEVAVQTLVNNAALVSSAHNLSDALTTVMRHAARFVGANEEEALFGLDVTKAVRDLSIEERQQMLLELEAGILAPTEVRAALERAGHTTLEAEAAFSEAAQRLQGESDNGSDIEDDDDS